MAIRSFASTFPFSDPNTSTSRAVMSAVTLLPGLMVKRLPRLNLPSNSPLTMRSSSLETSPMMRMPLPSSVGECEFGRGAEGAAGAGWCGAADAAGPGVAGDGFCLSHWPVLPHIEFHLWVEDWYFRLTGSC